MLSVVLLVLSKSSGSGNILFPTSWPEGKGSLSGPLTFWSNLVASTYVGGKLLCLHKAVNVCGLKDLVYFQSKIILGMRETKRRATIKEKRGKTYKCMLLFSLHFVLNWTLLTGCKTTGWCYSIVTWYCTVSPLDFHALTKLVWTSAVSALGSKQEPVAGQTGALGGYTRTTCTTFVEQLVRQIFTLPLAEERLWILLKVCPISCQHVYCISTSFD